MGIKPSDIHSNPSDSFDRLDLSKVALPSMSVRHNQAMDGITYANTFVSFPAAWDFEDALRFCVGNSQSIVVKVQTTVLRPSFRNGKYGDFDGTVFAIEDLYTTAERRSGNEAFMARNRALLADDAEAQAAMDLLEARLAAAQR